MKEKAAKYGMQMLGTPDVAMYTTDVMHLALADVAVSNEVVKNTTFDTGWARKAKRWSTIGQNIKQYLKELVQFYPDGVENISKKHQRQRSNQHRHGDTRINMILRLNDISFNV